MPFRWSQGVFRPVMPLPLIMLAAFAADSGRSYHVSIAVSESLWVTEWGQGPPVVLIPGLFGSAYSFRHVVPRLAEQGYRAIVIEPLGVGFSARPERANYSLTAQAERVAGVMERLGATGAVIIGHSVGASVAFRLAYRRPDLVRGIVSVEGGPAESVMTPGMKAAVRFIPWVKWMGGMKVMRSRVRKGMIESSGDASWVTDEVVDGYTAGAAVSIDQTLKSMITMSTTKEPEKLKAHLGEIHAPVRLLVGSASRGGIPRVELQLLRSTLSSLAVDTIHGAGLYIQEERPLAIVHAVKAVMQ